MNKSIKLFLIFQFIIVSTVLAQNTTLLRPVISGSMGRFAYTDKSFAPTPDIKVQNKIANNNWWDLGLMVDIIDHQNEKQFWSIGFVLGTWGYTYKIAPVGTQRTGALLSWRETYRLPIQWSYIPKIITFPSPRKIYSDYTLKPMLVLGANIDYTRPSDFGSFAREDDSFTLYGTEKFKLKTNFSASISIGVGLQLQNKGRDRLRFDIVYNQGLFNILEVDMHYTKGIETYQTRIKTRGSNLCLQVSYPIRLFSSYYRKKDKN